VIRILLVDDHPAMRTGLTAVLRAEPGLVALDAVESPDDLDRALKRTRPDVVLLDYHLPREDGLVVCRQLKRSLLPPAVLIYSAYADAQLVVPALLAGADGLLNKSAPAKELYDAIRTVARGEKVLPPVARELYEAAAEKLDPEDLPILGMAVEGTSPADMAESLRIDGKELHARIDRMLSRLRVDIATPHA
jgi:DNA-binding NarL/FixJ family response regulator